MSFEYSCFISYPHGQDDVLVPLVENFVAGLETEIFALSRKKVWVDTKFLQGGHRLDEKIGPDLCKSACMVLIYTPLYFDTEHVYCARELKAMRDLEEQRLKLLRDRGKGLIIPVVLRGEKNFPKALGEKRLYYNFTDIEFNNPDHIIRVKYAKQIKEIAEYIFDRCELLDEIADNLLHNCDEFDLPTSQDAKKFVEEVLGKKVTAVAVPFLTTS